MESKFRLIEITFFSRIHDRESRSQNRPGVASERSATAGSINFLPLIRRPSRFSCCAGIAIGDQPDSWNTLTAFGAFRFVEMNISLRTSINQVRNEQIIYTVTVVIIISKQFTLQILHDNINNYNKTEVVYRIFYHNTWNKTFRYDMWCDVLEWGCASRTDLKTHELRRQWWLKAPVKDPVGCHFSGNSVRCVRQVPRLENCLGRERGSLTGLRLQRFILRNWPRYRATFLRSWAETWRPGKCGTERDPSLPKSVYVCQEASGSCLESASSDRYYSVTDAEGEPCASEAVRKFAPAKIEQQRESRKCPG